MLEIKTKEVRSVDLIKVSGRLYDGNADELERCFKKLANNGRYNLVVDMGDIKYVAAAGLRVLVRAFRECRKQRGDLRIANPSDRVKEVLDLADLNDVFIVYDDTTKAIGSF